MGVNYRCKDFKDCLRDAKRGKAEAQYFVALHIEMETSKGNIDNLKLTDKERDPFSWYEKAAHQGHALAQVALGDYFSTKADNHENAIKWYTEAANKGNADAQRKLGLKHYGQDNAQSIHWLKKAAAQHDEEAMRYLGNVYLKSGDEKSAVASWVDAFKYGDVFVCINLGWAYSCGRGVERDYRTAAKYFKDYGEIVPQYKFFSQEGSGIDPNRILTGYSLYCVWEIYRGVHQDFIDKDDDIATDFIKRAANSDYAPACFELAELLVKFNDVSAQDWYLKAANYGYGYAQLALGNFYYYGETVEKNLAQAFDWYRIAADKGIEEARLRLAKMYINGEGTTKNTDKAIELFELVGLENPDYAKSYCKPIDFKTLKEITVPSGIFEITYKTASSNISGYPFYCAWLVDVKYEKDAINNLHLLERAAEESYIPAQIQLSINNYLESHREASLVEFKKWFEKIELNDKSILGDLVLDLIALRNYNKFADYSFLAEWLSRADKNYAPAQYVLAKIYLNENEKSQDALTYLSRAAESNFIPARRELAKIFFDDENTHSKWLAQLRYAALQDDVQSQAELGSIYFYGTAVEKNLEEAFKWFLKAAQGGDASSKYYLAKIYYNGIGVEKDYNEAFKWCAQSANSIHPNRTKSMYLLAEMYRQGNGVEQNFGEAIKLFKEITESIGFDEFACYRLGEIYEQGVGVEQNYRIAYYYYNRARLFNRVTKDVVCAQIYYNLGWLYYRGIFECNLMKAKEFFMIAQENGYACDYILNIVKAELGENNLNNEIKNMANNIKYQNLTNDAMYNKVSEIIQKSFGSEWNSLSEDSRNLIKCGLIQYVFWQGIEDESIRKSADYTGVVMPIVKAFEIELSRVFYVACLKFMKEHKIKASDFGEKNNLIYSDLGEYREDHKLSNFSLGALEYIIEVRPENAVIDESVQDIRPMIAQNNGDKIEYYTINERIYAFAESVFKEDVFSHENRKKEVTDYLVRLAQLSKTIAYKYRNPAAHKDVVTIIDAEECANKLIMRDKDILRFIQKIKPEVLKEIQI